MARVQHKGIADAQEPVALETGVHNLRIVKASHGAGKGDPTKFRVEVMLDCPDQPDKNAVFFYIGDPNPEGEAKSENFKALMAKRFLTHFDIEFDETGFDLDDFLGKTASTRIVTSKSEDGRMNTNLDLPPIL